MNKTCNAECQRTLPLEAFRFHKGNNKHVNQCRDCERASNRARMARASQTNEYKTKKASYDADYYMQNSDKKKQYASDYAKANLERDRERRRENNANRRALLKERTQTKPMRGWWKALQEFYGNTRCMNPDCKTPEAKPTLDHVLALENGGWHEWANWQILCGPCNSSKNAFHNTDYRPFPKLIDRKVS